MFAEDSANGLGDVGRGEHGEGDLIEERLKDVVVAAVDDGDINGEPGQALCRIDAGKAAAYDDDAGTGGWDGFGQCAYDVPPL
jgi:hypothetical protein